MPLVLGLSKPVIGMAHVPALPGRRGYDRAGGMANLYASVARDLEALQSGGVDAVLFANEGDVPYRAHVRAPEVAAMAAVISRLAPQLSVPFGIDLMWDPVASLAVAAATGGAFVRGVLMGEYESDMGTLAPDAADLFDVRHNLGADAIALFHNVTPEFAAPLSRRSVGERASSAAYLGVDALLISGPAAGRAIRREDLSEVREAVPDLPVLINTGVTDRTVGDYLKVADGVIVGTHLKQGANTWNPVDSERVRRFMAVVRAGTAGEDASGVLP